MRHSEVKYSEIKHYKFILREDFRITIPGLADERAHNNFISLDHGEMIIKTVYVWDGSSIWGKKFIKRITFGKIDLDKYCKIASLVHDALCQLMQQGLLNKKYKGYADGLYRDMIVEYVEELYKKAKTKKEKRIAKRRVKRVKRTSNIRYWFLRKSGTRYLKKKKYLPGQILTA